MFILNLTTSPITLRQLGKIIKRVLTESPEGREIATGDIVADQYNIDQVTKKRMAAGMTHSPTADESVIVGDSNKATFHAYVQKVTLFPSFPNDPAIKVEITRGDTILAQLIINLQDDINCVGIKYKEGLKHVSFWMDYDKTFPSQEWTYGDYDLFRKPFVEIAKKYGNDS